MIRFTDSIKIFSIMLVLQFCALTAFSEVIPEDNKILPDDGVTGDDFGYSIALDSGVVAVGAKDEGEQGSRAGSAYLFDLNTGAQLFKLQPDDGADHDRFGVSIAIEGGITVVGSFESNAPYNGSGSAYLFDVSTGSQLYKLVPSDVTSNKAFGFSVDIDNGLVAVSAVGDGTNGAYSGAAYIFDAETGAQLHKLLPDDGAASDGFGQSIAIENGLVVVGSYHDDDNGSNSGSAYLFDAQTGDQLAKLLPEDGNSSDEFGISADIENNTVVIGARYEYYGFGAVYLFDATTYAQTVKIKPNELAQNTDFGSVVAISNNIVAVGENRSNLNYDRAGSVFLFDAITGEQISRHQPSDALVNHYFGKSVALENGILVSGAVGDQDNGFAAGAMYVFEFGGGGVSAVPQVAAGLNMHPNHPNPFNPSTTIGFSLETDGFVELNIYSARGEFVRNLVSEFLRSGTVQSVVWDGKDGIGSTMSSGVYYARLVGNSSAVQKKMVLLK